MLIQKNKDMRSEVSNQGPNKFLLQRKLLTDLITNELCGFLTMENLLPEEQKFCRKKSKRTIASTIINETRIRKKSSKNDAL